MTTSDREMQDAMVLALGKYAWGITGRTVEGDDFAAGFTAGTAHARGTGEPVMWQHRKICEYGRTGWRNGRAPADLGEFSAEERPLYAHPAPAQPGGVKVKALDVDALAQEIRRVDGEHKLGAGALAEALMPLITASTPSPSAWNAGAEAMQKDAAAVVESFAPGGENYEPDHDDASMRVAIRGAIRARIAALEEEGRKG